MSRDTYCSGTFIGQRISDDSIDLNNTEENRLKFTLCFTPTKNYPSVFGGGLYDSYLSIIHGTYNGTKRECSMIEIINGISTYSYQCKLIIDKSKGTVYLHGTWKSLINSNLSGKLAMICEEDIPTDVLSGIWIGQSDPDEELHDFFIPINPIRWCITIFRTHNDHWKLYGSGYFNDSADIPDQPLLFFTLEGNGTLDDMNIIKKYNTNTDYTVEYRGKFIELENKNFQFQGRWSNLTAGSYGSFFAKQFRLNPLISYRLDICICEICGNAINPGDNRWCCFQCTYNTCSSGCHLNSLAMNHKHELIVDILPCQKVAQGNTSVELIENAFQLFHLSPLLVYKNQETNEFTSMSYEEIGLLLQSVIVPINGSLHIDAIKHTLSITNPSIIVIDEQYYDKVNPVLSSNQKDSLMIIYKHEEQFLHQSKTMNNTTNIISLTNALEFGETSSIDIKSSFNLSSTTISAIFSTSGSTGYPKGAIFTEDLIVPTDNFTLISPFIRIDYQPFDPTILLSLMTTIRYGSSRGLTNLNDMWNDIKYIKPTSLGLTPQLWNLIYKNYLSKLNDNLTLIEKESVEKEIRNELGGRVHVGTSGVNTSSSVQTTYASELTTNSSTYFHLCSSLSTYYEAIQVTVHESGLYTFLSHGYMHKYGSIHKDYFNPSNPSENRLPDEGTPCNDNQFRFTVALETSIAYILIVTTSEFKMTGEFSISVSGPNDVNLKNITSPSVIEIPYSSAEQSIYSSELNTSSQTYSRDCRKSNYYYQTIRVNVMETGYYALSSSSSMDTFGYIYEDDFNPMNPLENLLSQDYRACSYQDFKLIVYLYTGTTYILVMTTSSPNMTGDFDIKTSGPNNITLDRYTQALTSCFIGQKCQFYKKSIGVILDDILRDEIRSNMTLADQTILMKINAASTMIMFAGGLINSILSLMTFQSEDLRQVGCGIYLLASSITSFLTISMFTVKFWFVVLTQMNLSIRVSVVRGGCVSIEPLLKLCLYLDAWLNACVAIERAILVLKGINFNKQKSQRIARWIILILPFCIMGSIIHEPIYRELYEVNTKTSKADIDKWCVTRYSSFVQQYNTTILFFHLVGPCIVNLCSALFIIFGSARQRATAQTRRTLKEHVYDQFSEHKHLLISPIILLILSLPRLIMSMLSECVNPSNHRLLFIFGYFISFTPSMLIFIVFVLPSALYRKTFQESFRRWRRLIRH
ncbi:unnamed protein product [Adineta steineri]|uniref:long-chain-fatty-acid--CoA ligase n=1 Tax=Adineta steineri TaxID=433720 RepID=A0A815XGI8_9BILA|nr:unnamed protein product [Adineta steineri]